MWTIRQLREARGWTREQLAYTLGLSVATVYKWEAGTSEPRSSTLRALAELFGVSMDDIEIPVVASKQGRRGPKSTGGGKALTDS
jgi:transcriptional regulator with XRE-family HTH domain